MGGNIATLVCLLDIYDGVVQGLCSVNVWFSAAILCWLLEHTDPVREDNSKTVEILAGLLGVTGILLVVAVAVILFLMW